MNKILEIILDIYISFFKSLWYFGQKDHQIIRPNFIRLNTYIFEHGLSISLFMFSCFYLESSVLMQ